MRNYLVYCQLITIINFKNRKIPKNMKRKCTALLAAVAVFCLFLPLLTGCTAQEASDKLKIVTTVFPPYDFARQIGGDRIELTMLLSPGEEVHTYEPSPKDIIAMENADLFLCVGGESEAWTESVLSSLTSNRLTVVRMTECVTALEEETVDGMQTGHGHDGDESEPELDEHVWTSPKNAVLILEQIRDAMCKADPQHAEAYTANAAAYAERLRALDAEYAALFANGGEIVVADRFPFRYLAHDYGITYYAAYPGCSNDAEPSAATVRFLVDRVRQDGIPVVFTIEFSNGKLADILCEETGCRRLELHSCHNLSKSDFDAGVSYADLTERNLTNLKEALS